MDEEKKEDVSEEKTETETREIEKEEEVKTEETKEDFEKEEEVVPAGKYNQSIRKLREMELENRELKKLADTKPEKEKSKDEEEDVFKEEKLPDINHLIDEKVKPVLERLSRREDDDRKNQRDTFFTKHPEYLDAKKWNELLDEVDNSLNPNSKDNHYTQLEKAHRIISGDNSEISNKKKEMASDSASKGDGANKPESKKSSMDDREDRLSRQMPKGYEFK